VLFGDSAFSDRDVDNYIIAIELRDLSSTCNGKENRHAGDFDERHLLEHNAVQQSFTDISEDLISSIFGVET
jgi:hypothetical protein